MWCNESSVRVSMPWFTPCCSLSLRPHIHHELAPKPASSTIILCFCAFMVYWCFGVFFLVGFVLSATVPVTKNSTYLLTLKNVFYVLYRWRTRGCKKIMQLSRQRKMSASRHLPGQFALRAAGLAYCPNCPADPLAWVICLSWGFVMAKMTGGHLCYYRFRTARGWSTTPNS